MSTPHLPDDCIYYIIKHLRNDRSSLYKCAKVNRFWCRAAIPILYENPFPAKNKKIIMNYILSFSKEEVLSLKDAMKFCGYGDFFKIKKNYKTLFEYPKFLKNYNYKDVNSTIFKYFMNFTVLNYYNCHKDKIICGFCPLFHQLIINKCNHLEQFNINMDSFIKPKINKNHNQKDIISLLEPLVGIEKRLLNNLTLNCSNLREINFTTTYNEPVLVENFCKVIQNQKNLEKFISQHLLNDDIISSLELQNHSLISIDLSCINFSEISFNNFINLKNLKFLKFNYCNDYDPFNRYEILQFASFKLQKLELKLNQWDEIVEPTIIKYLGSSLKYLSIHSNLTVPMLENISIYCLNLIELKIAIYDFSKIDYLIFPCFLKIKIRKLIINIPHSFGTYTTEMITRLANNLSINTNDITLNLLNQDLEKSIHFFKTFFENAHSHLKKFKYNYAKVGSVSIKIILDYINSNDINRLEVLNIIGMKKSFEVDDLKYYNEIKAKGVKIIKL